MNCGRLGKLVSQFFDEIAAEQENMDKFQITRFLRFATQITRFTIFSCLARFPSNQFTQSPTIRVSGYPVAKICHVRLPGRPNFSSRLPGNDIFPAQRNFIKKCRFQITQHGEMSFPAYPTRRNVVSRLPGRRNFFFPDHPVVGCAG